MLSKSVGYVISGLDGFGVDVEVDINNGLPTFEIVGLPDTAIKESKERVRSAIKNSGIRFPNNKITVNLAPADLKKEGAGLDLPIAMGIIKASGQLGNADFSGTVMIGELSLDGGIRGVDGILPMLISAKDQGYKTALIPYENLKESSYIRDMQIYAVKSLREIYDYYTGISEIKSVEPIDYAEIGGNVEYSNDLKYIKGQFIARRALEIAVSGNHNIMLVGPPGAGKTMLAKCIPSIMPDMTFEESLETTKIHSVSGALKNTEGIVYHRPFMTPHHTASNVSMIGGGQNSKPGIISLAHNGVLFLDEMPEYTRSVLESLRQPLEDREITVARAKTVAKYPSNFMLIGSMNPCPCGYYGSKQKECKCTPSQIQKYKAKVSGPLLDRIDIKITVDGVKYDELTEKAEGESSAEVRKRVNKARLIQRERFADDGIFTNAEMGEKQLQKYCELDAESESILKTAFDTLNLSARARSRILKVARTIADLDFSENIKSKHVLEAISYRNEEI